MKAKQKFDLDTPLVIFGDNSVYPVRAACEGILITGGLGSGKTSGSYSFIFRRFLMQGFGGLILTVKPQETEEYRKLCIEAGREKDLIIIEPGGEHSFNWLEYESQTRDNERPITDNILEVLKVCIKAGAEQDVGRGDDGFWKQAMDSLITKVIDLSILAYGKITTDIMYHIVQSLPRPQVPGTEKQGDGPSAFDRAWNTAKEKVHDKRHKWHESSSDEEKEQKLTEQEYIEKLHDAVPDARTLDFLAEFFFDSFKYLNPKTRSIIEFIFSGFLAGLLREPVYSLFSKNPSTVTPEDCFNGKIVLVNLPVKKYNETGRNVQLIVKYIFQRAWERRKITDWTVPVFLAADEAYTFVHEHDTLFQATARSSRICTLYVTQNLANYHAAMGGEKAKYRVTSLISTLATKIFHANTDLETNEYAASLVGENFQPDPSMNMSVSSENFTHGEGLSMKLQKIYRPEFFISLKCGGPRNNFNVQAVIHKQGDPINGTANHLLVNFKQQIN